jgi:hypothetical protein
VFALTVRLPDDLGAALRERAKVDARSINREVEFLLRQALYPSIEADAYRASRQTLVIPRTTARRSRA